MLLAALTVGGLTLTACVSTPAASRAHRQRDGGHSTTTQSTVASTTTTRAKASTTSTSTTTTTTTAPVPAATVAPTTLPIGFSTTYTAPAPAPPALAQPTAAHPLTILEIGDSLGEDLGNGMGDVLGSDPLVHVIADAVGDSGLARPDYYNWPLHLQQELAQFHPGAVVVMLGGDDGQSFIDAGRYVQFGTSLWHMVYSERVGDLMNEATRAGAHVFWVGMPIMGQQYLSDEMALENQVFAQQAAIHPGVTYFSSWNLFTNSAGQYAQYLPDSSGQLVMMRDPDGVHLTGAGWDRLANAIVVPMEQAFGVKLVG